MLETTISDRKAVNHYKLKRPMRVFVVVDNSPSIEVESILPKCQNMATEADLYLVSSTPTKSNQQIALQVINALARSHSRIFTIDQMNGDQLQTVYSNERDQRVVQSIANNSLAIAPVTPQGIVAPFQRLHTFGKNPSNIILQAYRKWFILLASLLLHFLYSLLCIYTLPITLTQLSAVSNNRVKFRRDNVPRHKISRELFLALIASEDTQYLSHHGFAWDEIRQAIGNGWGGSGISQQTAKNVFTWQNRDWLCKGIESYSTILIEGLWGKERILEIYVNTIEFEDGIYGVEAISQEIFNKPASQINRREAAMIAACVPRHKGCLRGDWNQMRKVQKHIINEMNYLESNLETKYQVRDFLDHMSKPRFLIAITQQISYLITTVMKNQNIFLVGQ
jgi:monofunctional glycosyltransferase